MKRWLLLSALSAAAVLGGWAVHASATGGSVTGGKTMTDQDLMGTLQATLEGEHRLAIHKIDCSAYYEAGYKGTNACYGSSVGTQELVSMLQGAVDKLAFSGGWREDYGVWGSFYEARDGSRRTFGITVNPVQGNDELQAIREIKSFRNFVTVTVDQPR